MTQRKVSETPFIINLYLADGKRRKRGLEAEYAEEEYYLDPEELEDALEDREEDEDFDEDAEYADEQDSEYYDEEDSYYDDDDEYDSEEGQDY